MGSRKYLVLFHVVSAGENGEGLGSDEADIVLVLYLVLDIVQNKIVLVKKVAVRPTSGDHNQNILSDEVKSEFELCEGDVKGAGTLGSVIHQLDKSWRDEIPGNFTIMTDGPLVIRQTLFPEAFRKNIPLPAYYQNFHDLRKEFQSICSTSIPQEKLTVDEMLGVLGVTSSSIADPALRHVNNMAVVVQKLLLDGGHLHEPEPVLVDLLQGIRTRNEQVDTNCVVRARGLPWQASDTDIARFFVGLNVAPGGVALCLSAQGRRNGEALVLLESAAHRDMALRRHKHHIGNRYIEVYKATGDDFMEVAGGNNTEAQEFLSRGGQVIIRMRGLPYDCSSKQVMEFFSSGTDPCKVLDDDHGVLFVKKPDGRATGDAFVLFSEDGEGEKALSKHKELIGSRYIELFRSTTAEVQQVLNRSIEPVASKSSSLLPMGGHPAPASPLMAGLPSVPHMTVIPQQLITAGIKKDCIRLRGLPYEAQVEHILEFLGDHARNIVVQGVHMVFNAQGQPSGEAFIQMDGEVSSHGASSNRHNRYMVIGKKQRYIEVLQCSGEDMSMVLTGGLAPPTTPAKSPLMSPGTRVTSPHPSFPFSPVPLHSPTTSPFPQFPAHLFCWPYPSPPSSRYTPPPSSRYISYLPPSLLSPPFNMTEPLSLQPNQEINKLGGGGVNGVAKSVEPPTVTTFKPSVFIH